jgi:hypothetical protein
MRVGSTMDRHRGQRADLQKRSPFPRRTRCLPLWQGRMMSLAFSLPRSSTPSPPRVLALGVEKTIALRKKVL